MKIYTTHNVANESVKWIAEVKSWDQRRPTRQNCFDGHFFSVIFRFEKQTSEDFSKNTYAFQQQTTSSSGTVVKLPWQQQYHLLDWNKIRLNSEQHLLESDSVVWLLAGLTAWISEEIDSLCHYFMRCPKGVVRKVWWIHKIVLYKRRHAECT